MTPDEQAAPMNTTEQLMVAMVRVETKIDTLIAASSDHEGRIRTLEQAPRDFVTSKQLWSVVIGASTIVGALAQIVYYGTGR